MSYSIIFETVFVKLSDGRLLHLDRSGCNNDNSGRSRDEFTGKIYTTKGLTDYANRFMERTTDKQAFELKIRSRYCSFYQYGEHLLRMAKRAIPFEELCLQRYVSAARYDGAEIFEPERKILTPKEFDDYWYEKFYCGTPIAYRRIFTPLKTEEDIVKALEQKDSVSFYIGKRYKAAVNAGCK